jgi:uncharacterized protein (TIGR02444 family)
MTEHAAEPVAAAAFWRFSLEFYRRPGVAEALIALQDRERGDVNLMLFALWLGFSGRPLLGSDGLAAAECAVATIRSEVVEPLRRIRRRLKHDAASDIQDLRRRVAALEIDAEKVAQVRLAATAAAAAELPLAVRLAAAEANLATCLGSAGAGCVEAALLLRSLATFARHRR